MKVSKLIINIKHKIKSFERNIIFFSVRRKKKIAKVLLMTLEKLRSSHFSI